MPATSMARVSATTGNEVWALFATDAATLATLEAAA